MALGDFEATREELTAEVKRRQGYVARTSSLAANEQSRLVSACRAIMAKYGYAR